MTVKTYKRDTQFDSLGTIHNGTRVVNFLERRVQPEKIICVHDTNDDEDIQVIVNGVLSTDKYIVSLISVTGEVLNELKTTDKNEANRFWKKLTDSIPGGWKIVDEH